MTTTTYPLDESMVLCSPDRGFQDPRFVDHMDGLAVASVRRKPGNKVVGVAMGYRDNPGGDRAFHVVAIMQCGDLFHVADFRVQELSHLQTVWETILK